MKLELCIKPMTHRRRDRLVFSMIHKEDEKIGSSYCVIACDAMITSAEKFNYIYQFTTLLETQSRQHRVIIGPLLLIFIPDIMNDMRDNM